MIHIFLIKRGNQTLFIWLASSTWMVWTISYKFPGSTNRKVEEKQQRKRVEETLDYYVFPGNRLNIFGCKVNFMPLFSWKCYPVGR